MHPSQSYAHADLFCQIDEAELYHNAARFGFFSILYALNGRKHQRSFRLPLMAQVLPLLPRDRDTWLSQSEFIKPNRRIVNLARLTMLFVDLDCYDREINAALSELLWRCDQESLPHPSIVIFSGRGLQAKWLFDESIPRWTLPRWNAVQSRLIDSFKDMCSDPNAKDAARVLRLVHTTNTKTGETVRVIHTTRGSNGEPMRYGFEYLAEVLLPNSRDAYDKKLKNHPYTIDAQIEIAAARQLRQVNYEARQLRKQIRLIHDGVATSGLKRFSGRQLAWHRLEDIRKLVEMRGEVRQGMGMTTLFWSLNFLLLSGATNSVQMYYEAAALANEYGFGQFYRQDELSTLYTKAKEHEAGKMVTLNGIEYPALYTPTNNRLIELLQITADEQKHLRTIISPDEARARDALRKREQRKNAGAVSREAYITANNEKRTQARLLKKEGKSNRAIATQLGVSEFSIRQWVR